MLNKDNRSQLDRIAGIIGCDFGIADTEGRVRYSGSYNIKEGDIISVPDTEEQEGIVEKGDMLFAYYASEESDPTWFFIAYTGDDRENKTRLLELALCAYDNRSEVRKRKKTDFFRNLLSGGYSSVDVNDFNTYTAELRSDIDGYTVVTVSQTMLAYDESNAGMLEDFLFGMFPPREGYIVVADTPERICIICPVDEENTFEELLKTADLISDTIRSELMFNVNVAVGTLVPSLKSIDAAFKTAERAETVGKIFEFEGKSFVYDKLGLARLVYGLSKESCMAFLKETLGPQIVEDKGWLSSGKSGTEDEIKKTIKTFLEMNQNISETARALYIHRNTLVYRLEKFNKMTGLDCTRFEDGMKIGMALLVLQYMSKMQK